MEVKEVYIVDRLERLADCACISPAFAKAVEFLQRSDLASLAPGRHDIDGDNCFAIVNDAAELVPPSERKVELHRVYFDIQIPLSGEETYGLAEFDPAAEGSFDESKALSMSRRISASTTKRSCRSRSNRANSRFSFRTLALMPRLARLASLARFAKL